MATARVSVLSATEKRGNDHQPYFQIPSASMRFMHWGQLLNRRNHVSLLPFNWLLVELRTLMTTPCI